MQPNHEFGKEAEKQEAIRQAKQKKMKKIIIT